MPTSEQTTPTRRPLRHMALDDSAMSAPPGQQGRWTYRGEPEQVNAGAPRPTVKLTTSPTPAITRYSRSGEVEELLVGPERPGRACLRSVPR